ncbi:chromo domain-containing protein cec-1 [Aplysia californica]|uniref:Chromo domain-containing protein cec-1 n=1 Tax=Aplysia californica TaxID=6500 RepID=A0ABM1A5J3_APLCA|nr:chromo domain-containing protein cec-1 [Aplysia californica]
MGTNSDFPTFDLKMANFSDDEKLFEVDSILEQRKRKGVLEYLVRWKDADAGEDTSWEPADSIIADCAQAVKSFLKAKSAKRSSSRSRKSSRSRSRSSSRSRKATTKKETTKTAVRRSSRSRSKGRLSKTSTEEKKDVEEVKEKAPVKEKSPEKVTVVANNSSSTVVASVSTSSTTTQSAMAEKKRSASPEQGRVLRSSTVAAREKLEVQRVHNEQRPVREDDNQPRSAVWRVADYAVIVLFIISVIAAIFLFVEKFVDLEDFKKQAFPNMNVLKARLIAAQQNLVEVVQTLVARVSQVWLHIVDSDSAGHAPQQSVPTKQ